MKLEGSYDVAAPRAKVWEAFLDPKQLRKAIPGCEKLEALGPDEFKATLKIGVAAVKGTFEGDRKSTRLNSSHGYTSYASFCLKKKNTTCRKCPHKVHRMEMKTAISCTILSHTKILIPVRV